MKKFIVSLLAACLLSIGCSTQKAQGPLPVIGGEGLYIMTSVYYNTKQVIITDAVYRTVPDGGVLNYLPRVNNRFYRTDSWDCDDFAFDELVAARRYADSKHGVGFGITVGVIGYVVVNPFSGEPRGLHAANIILTDEGSFLIFDARTRKFVNKVEVGEVIMIIW